jgi:hypothetical protein
MLGAQNVFFSERSQAVPTSPDGGNFEQGYKALGSEEGKGLGCGF